ncbi:MAG: hypothetical protein A2231_10460 [Candidatus Firestonebacteria bacterium RIFOXYA2_FULL_40_8]|nr:MAG: hypothetical protein A2231_10460 [Candidatus Firestonebacteria bacterium RIFOXYA2_FULL_40_8]
MKTVQAITVTIPNELVAELNRMQKTEMKNCSSIVAEALKEYIEWRQFKGLQKEAAAVARAIGVYDESDVERLVHEYRAGK